jgi:CheY-like chemotaxis protein
MPVSEATWSAAAGSGAVRGNAAERERATGQFREISVQASRPRASSDHTSGENSHPRGRSIRPKKALCCSRFATAAQRGLRLAYLFSQVMREALQILAVEDEKALAQILAVVLGGPAAKITRAADGWEALMKIGVSERPFDVVITDHRMPRMSGLELVRQLRKRNFQGKILVLSAHLSDDDIRAYEEQNVDMMMSKPFDFEELQSAVALLTKGASVAVAA